MIARRAIQGRGNASPPHRRSGGGVAPTRCARSLRLWSGDFVSGDVRLNRFPLRPFSGCSNGASNPGACAAETSSRNGWRYRSARLPKSVHGGVDVSSTIGAINGEGAVAARTVFAARAPGRSGRGLTSFGTPLVIGALSSRPWRRPLPLKDARRKLASCCQNDEAPSSCARVLSSPFPRRLSQSRPQCR